MSVDLGAPDARLTVDLDALAANWRALARRAAPAECAGVVKADAYGLGMAPVARALAGAGCRRFFVAHPEEGAALRQVLAGAEIYVLHGLRPGAAAAYLALGLLPVLSEAGELEAWRAHARTLGRPLPAALQLDSGMTRLGLDPATALDDLAGVEVRLLMSHLACADERENPANERQRAAFAAAAVRLPGVPRSLAASSGIFLGDGYLFELVRPGIAVYGGNPTPGAANPMRPAVRLEARILQVHDIAAACAVGYGATFTAPAGSRIATVAAGYADGILRRQGGRGRATVADREVPVVGRVSMDLLALDVSGLPEVRPGDMAVLLSERVTIDDMAAAADTVGYEILTRLGRRAARVYLGGGPA